MSLSFNPSKIYFGLKNPDYIQITEKEKEKILDRQIDPNPVGSIDLKNQINEKEEYVNDFILSYRLVEQEEKEPVKIPLWNRAAADLNRCQKLVVNNHIIYDEKALDYKDSLIAKTVGNPALKAGIIFDQIMFRGNFQPDVALKVCHLIQQQTYASAFDEHIKPRKNIDPEQFFTRTLNAVTVIETKENKTRITQEELTEKYAPDLDSKKTTFFKNKIRVDFNSEDLLARDYKHINLHILCTKEYKGTDLKVAQKATYKSSTDLSKTYL